MGPAQGWQCPECKTIYAPHIPLCECAKRVDSVASTAGAHITVPVNSSGTYTLRNNELEKMLIDGRASYTNGN